MALTRPRAKAVMTEQPIDPDDEFIFLSIPEAAAFLRTSARTVRHLTASGAIPVVKLGPRTHRVTRASLIRFARSGGVRADD